jgi:hypothetical protein
LRSSTLDVSAPPPSTPSRDRDWWIRHGILWSSYTMRCQVLYSMTSIARKAVNYTTRKYGRRAEQPQWVQWVVATDATLTTWGAGESRPPSPCSRKTATRGVILMPIEIRVPLLLIPELCNSLLGNASSEILIQSSPLAKRVRYACV